MHKHAENCIQLLQTCYICNTFPLFPYVLYHKMAQLVTTNALDVLHPSIKWPYIDQNIHIQTIHYYEFINLYE